MIILRPSRLRLYIQRCVGIPFSFPPSVRLPPSIFVSEVAYLSSDFFSTAPVAGRRTSLDLISISAPFHITLTLTTNNSLFLQNLNHVHHTRCCFRCFSCVPYRTGISQSSAHAFTGTFMLLLELGILTLNI
jgi:hypothetical protein